MPITRPSAVLLTAAALLAGGLAVASPAAAAPAPRTIATSPDGRYLARLTHGRLLVATKAGRTTWASTRTNTPATSAVLDRTGDLRLTDGRRTYWSSRTSGAGRSTLQLGNDGVLAVRASRLLVWSSRTGNACPRTSGKTFVVDISSQFARMCTNGNQIRATYVTTGARGTATPTGRWRVYAKQRNATLRPSSGGAFKVKYWVPYYGGYGVHEAPWQTFAYGSAKYRTAGSHGCVRTPLQAVKFFYGWVRVGTRVVVTR